MSKKLIFLVVLAALVFVWLIKAPLLSSYLTHELHIKVAVGNMSIWPSQMKISRFKMKNPDGFQSRTALQAESILVLYAWKQLTGYPSVIDEIILNEVYLGIEFANSDGSDNNWTRLIQKMPSGKGKRPVLIKKLIVKNLTVEIKGYDPLGLPQKQTFDQIEIDNVNSDKGFPTQQLIAQIFGNAGLSPFIEHVLPFNLIEDVVPF